MYVSFVNYMVGATVSVNTLNAVNTAGCVAQYTGDPVAFDDAAGVIGFTLSGVKRIRCWGFFDIRGVGHSVTLRLKNGGSGGATVLTRVVSLAPSGFYTGAPVNQFGSPASSAFDVNADYVEITMTSHVGAGYAHIGRIWIGDCVECSLADLINVSLVDSTTVEESKTGEEFFTENRLRLDISTSSLIVRDNLSVGAAASDGDYEHFVDYATPGIAETALFARDEFLCAVHGKLEPTRITKGPGNTYTLQPFTVRGF